MKELIRANRTLIPYKVGDMVEARVLYKTKSLIYVDVRGLNEGIIPEQEWGEEGGSLKEGDEVLARVLLMEDDKGRVILSLKKTDQQKTNLMLQQKYKNKENVSVKVIDANKGGLICETGAVFGFLPASQLSSRHYPRVSGDKEKILEKLKKLCGEILNVRVIGFDKQTNQPIFSEKLAQTSLITSIKKDDILEGTVSGITNFGVFVNLGDFDGLVHRSEVSWDFIDDLSKIIKIGQKIKVKVVDIQDGRIFLSIKRLIPNPFLKEVNKYKEGEIVEGTVIKIVPFGAFVKINKIQGLAKKDIKELKENKKYKFKIVKIDEKAGRLNLELVKKEKEKSKKQTSTKD